MKFLSILLSFCLFVCLLGCGQNSSNASAIKLINQIPVSWETSTDSFTNVAHKACDAIREIENPTNRLECAKEYAESLLNLNKFVRECDVQGYWARLAAYSNIALLIKNIDIESHWIIASRFRMAMKKELKEIDPLGSSTPMRFFRKQGRSEEEYNALVKENERRRVALQYRYYANQIRGCLRNLYKPMFEHSLREDCMKLSPERKEALLKMVIEITGETPEWYRKELEGKK